jgi:hypothetical protein
MGDATVGKAPSPRVLGGSLTRDRDGVLITVLTTDGGYFTPNVVQSIWSNVNKRSYPKTWDGAELPRGYVIRWRDPTRFLCGQCGRSLGDYVAYHVNREYGVVADTARTYKPHENFSGRPGGAAERRAPKRQRFELSGEVGYRAARTRAHFRCPRCGHAAPPYNLARLGRALFDAPRRQFRVGEDPMSL